LRKKRREQQIILIADESDFDAGIAAKHPVKIGGGLEAAKTRTDYDDALHNHSNLA
jgi:hypothetical protein